MKLYPALGIILFIVLTGMSLALTHPVYILIWTAFMVSILMALPHEKSRGYLIYYFGFTALMIIVVNPLVSQSGRTVLFMIRSVPLAGRIKITLEALIYGIFMALKLANVSMSFLIFSRVTEADDMFVFMSKVLPKSTILFSMTVNVFHRIREDISRIHDVMVMRGVVFDGGGGLSRLSGRIRGAIPLLKVVVLSAMEGSLDRAEALQSRGFGEKKRSAYRPVRPNGLDRIMAGFVAGLLCLILLVYSKGGMAFTYYPRLGSVTVGWEFQCVVFAALTGLYMLLKRVKQWLR